MKSNSGHERPFARLGQAFSCRAVIEVFGRLMATASLSTRIVSFDDLIASGDGVLIVFAARRQMFQDWPGHRFIDEFKS